MSATHVTDATFEAEVVNSPIPVMVDFWAPWCGPCKQMAPVVDEMAGKMGGRVKIVKVDVDANPSIATKLGISSVPTLMIFKGGEMVERKVGAQPRQKLEQWIGSQAA